MRRFCFAWMGLAIVACSGAPPRDDEARADAPTPPPVPVDYAIDDPSPPAPSTPSPVADPAQQPQPEVEPPSLATAVTCADSRDVAVFSSPRAPLPGAPLRVMVVSERPLTAAIVVLGPGGRELARSSQRRGGPPYFWTAEIVPPSEGVYRIGLGRAADIAACRDLAVATEAHRRWSPPGTIWRVTDTWNRATENFFSAWVEHLFDAPLGEQPSWRALHEVTQERARNFLHDHLGLSEDRTGPGGLRMQPDCADLPYFLRAYFAWKLGLPFGYSQCSRGGDGSPPRCGTFRTNLEPAPEGASGGGDISRFEQFLRVSVGWSVQSGAGRAPSDDSRSDLYPTRLSTETLRPGTVYADPYGHTLVVVRRIAQTPQSGGVLLAVDGQPDGTVARKRYWRGNFLYAVDARMGFAGFKHFRPIIRRGRGLRALTNDEIAQHPDYGDYSLEQDDAGVEGFYDRVDEVLSPQPLDPQRAFLETIQALDEQVRTRIGSVQNGEDYMAQGPGVVSMPSGASIFETRGPWEDFATPSRDLRLLIAIDTVRGYPGRVAQRASRYAMPAGQTADAVRASLEATLTRESRTREFRYRRTDGSAWTLRMADILARTTAFEVAYNPNDCVELRWGATSGSPEMGTCERRAPEDQIDRMQQYRVWFRERRRPARGQ